MSDLISLSFEGQNTKAQIDDMTCSGSRRLLIAEPQLEARSLEYQVLTQTMAP